MKIPFWLIYSYWSFALTALWLGGFIEWSPLVSALAALMGSILLLDKVTQASLFIVLTHIIPVWILRNTNIDLNPNLFVS